LIMQQYPMLLLLDRQGSRIAALIGLAFPLLGGWAIWNASASWIWLAAVCGGGIILYGIIKSYVELIRLMVDMLLPK
jgi:hypothetical protein